MHVQKRVLTLYVCPNTPFTTTTAGSHTAAADDGAAGFEGGAEEPGEIGQESGEIGAEKHGSSTPALTTLPAAPGTTELILTAWSVSSTELEEREETPIDAGGLYPGGLYPIL